MLIFFLLKNPEKVKIKLEALLSSVEAGNYRSNCTIHPRVWLGLMVTLGLIIRKLGVP